MKFNLVHKYPWEIFRYIHERNIPSSYTISITNCYYTELNIYLSKITSTGYGVMIYKTSKQQKYIAHPNDCILTHTESDDFDFFTFENFEFAHEFIDMLYYNHPEYYPRPNES